MTIHQAIAVCVKSCIKEFVGFQNMKVLGIDIGYHNIGLVLADCNKEKINVLYIQKVNLASYKTKKTPELSDMIDSFITDYSNIFCQAEQVLIERQPPGGIASVEVLLHYIFRDKAVLISPVSMHKHFNIGHLDYEQRKGRTELIAQKYLNDFEYYNKLSRKHDIADALCMIIYHSFNNGISLKKQQASGLFEDFMYVEEA